MIFNVDFARELFEELELELSNHEERHGIEILDFSSQLVNFDWLFKTQNFLLPSDVRGATDIVQVSKYHYQIIVNHLHKEHPKLVEKGINETVNLRFKGDIPARTIHAAITTKITNLLYQYNKVLEVTKIADKLFGIIDEEKILINHLNLYEEILSSETKQIKFFRGIILSKKISDLVVRAYVQFIHKRLKILNPKIEVVNKLSQQKKSTKILWKGSQKELCELFVELQKKGWISEIGYGKISQTANAICNLFDLTLTQKDDNSKTENSFYQILKVYS